MSPGSTYAKIGVEGELRGTAKDPLASFVLLVRSSHAATCRDAFESRVSHWHVAMNRPEESSSLNFEHRAQAGSKFSEPLSQN